MAIKAEFWGDYACFTRPEMKTERVSYDIITPSAARGLIEAVFWHPGLRWKIDRIYVLNPIRFSNIRRNEVSAKVSGPKMKSLLYGGRGSDYLVTSECIQQRAAMVLRDVRYVVEAHFEMTENAAPSDNEGKFCDIVRRRLERGECYHQPYFGCREFPAYFKLWEGGEIPTAYPDSEKDLGYMLYDMDYSNKENILPMFFRAEMKNGVVDLRNCEVLK